MMHGRIRELATQFFHWVASRSKAAWHKTAKAVTLLIEARGLGVRWTVIWGWRILKFAGGALAVIALAMLFGNWIFPSSRDVPYRALSERASPCEEGSEEGWDVLASADNGQVANDELSAIEKKGLQWQAKF